MTNKNKYLVYGVIIVVLVVAVVVLAMRNSKRSSQSGTSTSTSTNVTKVLPPPAPVNVTEVPSAQMPANFPSNLPVEKNAQVVQNQTIVNPNTGKTQASRTYVTKITIAKNLATYQSFLSANGWTVVGKVTQPTTNILTATKDSSTLTIILDYKNYAPQNRVSVDYVY